MAQFAQGFGFDLAHAFTRDVELLAHIFQRARDAIFQAKAHDQHFALALIQPFQDFIHVLFEQVAAGAIHWPRHTVIFDKVAQIAVFFVADRRVEAEWLLAEALDAPHTGRGALQAAGGFDVERVCR